jgi:hypothetical protein
LCLWTFISKASPSTRPTKSWELDLVRSTINWRCILPDAVRLNSRDFMFRQITFFLRQLESYQQLISPLHFDMLIFMNYTSYVKQTLLNKELLVHCIYSFQFTQSWTICCRACCRSFQSWSNSQSKPSRFQNSIQNFPSRSHTR